MNAALAEILNVALTIIGATALIVILILLVRANMNERGKQMASMNEVRRRKRLKRRNKK